MDLKTLSKIFLFSFLLILSACSGKRSADDTDFFLNDKSEIGIELVDQDLGIKFNPPKDWELKPSSLSKKIENKMNPNDGFVYQPVYLFFNNVTLALLSAGKVISTDSTLSGSAKFNYYKSYLATKYKESNSSLSNFSSGRINFTQIRYEKGNLISYKLFFKNSKEEIVQFEYSIRKEILENSIRSIKSSIGSIKAL